MSKAEDQYEAVRAVMSRKSVGVVAAIKEVAQKQKLKPGSIQTAYYRVARERGTTRQLEAQTRRIAATNAPENLPTDMIMSNIVTALHELVERHHELEVDSERLHEIESLLN